MNDQLILETLDCLMVLHGEGAHVDAGSLARHLGVRPTEVAQALLHLERKGLADAGTARLTLAGLTAAAALAAHRASRASRTLARAA